MANAIPIHSHLMPEKNHSCLSAWLTDILTAQPAIRRWRSDGYSGFQENLSNPLHSLHDPSKGGLECKLHVP